VTNPASAGVVSDGLRASGTGSLAQAAPTSPLPRNRNANSLVYRDCSWFVKGFLDQSLQDFVLG